MRSFLLLPFVAMLAPAAAQPGQAGLPLVLGGAASRVEWSVVAATTGNDWINDLVRLANGNVLGVGFVNRDDGNPAADWLALALEIEPGRTVVADRRYGQGGGTDAFWAVAEAPDGRRLFGGLTTRVGPGGINGYVLVSGADGTLVRESGFGRAGYDRFTDVAPAGGGFVFIGHSQLPEEGARRRIYIMKTDADGRQLWERIHDSPDSWSALYIEPAGDGGFVIAGGTDSGGENNMFVLKVDAAGNELWRRLVGTPDWDEINHGLVVRRDGRIVIAGYAHRRGEEANDLVAATLTPDGEVERIERFGGAGDERVRLASLAPDGNIWIVGHTASAGAGGSDLLLTALDGSGAFTGRVTTLGSPGEDIGTAVLEIDRDAVLVAGYSASLGVGGEDAFVARLARPAEGPPHPDFRRTTVQAP